MDTVPSRLSLLNISVKNANEDSIRTGNYLGFIGALSTRTVINMLLVIMMKMQRADLVVICLIRVHFLNHHAFHYSVNPLGLSFKCMVFEIGI